MIDYRNILRLHSEGHSQREIERELYCSRHTIADVLGKAKETGISWPLSDDVTNEMILPCVAFFHLYLSDALLLRSKHFVR